MGITGAGKNVELALDEMIKDRKLYDRHEHLETRIRLVEKKFP